MRQQLGILIVTVLVLSLFAPAAAGSDASAPADVQQATCEYPLELTDATGEQITLENEPESVVTLYPGDAQLAYAIGAEEKVVGMPVGPYTDSLDAGDRTDITEDDGVTPVAEEIVALDPDVVLAANIALYEEELLQTLDDAGITVIVLDTANSIDDVRENVRVTGEVTGECTGAEERIQWMNKRLEIIENALEGEERPLAYYASGEDGDTFGTETFQHDVLTTAGLENLAAEAGVEGWTQISPEVVVEEDPEWIVYPDRTDSPPGVENFQETTAVQEDNIVAVDDNAMSQPGPDVVYAVEELVQAVHPDVYDEIEADLEAVDDPVTTDENGGEANGNGDENASDDGDGDDSNEEEENAIPGFGVAVAVASLLAVTGFVARRR